MKQKCLKFSANYSLKRSIFKLKINTKGFPGFRRFCIRHNNHLWSMRG
jgi:hypothetical protein